MTSPFFTWSDSPVRELSSTFKSLLCISIPSAGNKSPGNKNKNTCYYGNNWLRVSGHKHKETAIFSCSWNSFAIFIHVCWRIVYFFNKLSQWHHDTLKQQFLYHIFKFAQNQLFFSKCFFFCYVEQRPRNKWRKWKYLPYLTWHISPTSISLTGSWTTSPLRITENLCSCSILLWSPLNCFSLRQSLKAVTKTTTKTAIKMATPSIHPASDSVSSPAKYNARRCSTRHEPQSHKI